MVLKTILQSQLLLKNSSLPDGVRRLDDELNLAHICAAGREQTDGRVHLCSARNHHIGDIVVMDICSQRDHQVSNHHGPHAGVVIEEHTPDGLVLWGRCY